MYCKSCGKEIPDGVRFCSNCVADNGSGIWWEYKLGNRLQKKAPDYQLMIQENGTTIVLWRLLGSLLCGVGTFVGSYILIKNVNLICSGYNRRNGLV